MTGAQPHSYRATFGRLGVTPLDLAATYDVRYSQDTAPTATLVNVSWAMLELPEPPKPQSIDESHTVSVDLFVDGATGGKLIDDIHLKVSAQSLHLLPMCRPYLGRLAIFPLPTPNSRFIRLVSP